MSPRPRPAAPAALLAAAAALLAVLCPAPAAHAAPAPIRSYTAAIEALSPYQAQSTCSPTAKPGVVAFKDLLLRTYANSRSMGIVRACDVGGRSEHKEGRAFDWGVRVNVAGEKAAADDMIRWLHATDKHGNAFANARRLGVQYLIWNSRIWSSYSPTWRAYTGSNPHTDHVHVSFNWAGANKQTSFWDGTVAGPGSAPAGSAPVAAPAPPPAPAVAAPSAAEAPPVRHEQSWTVQANRPGGNASPFSVERGERYVLTVSGTWSPGSGMLADAECWKGRGTTAWARTGPSGDAGDALVNGRDVDMRPVTPSRDVSGCDLTGHSYTAVVSPSRTGQVTIRVVDNGHSDNTGQLSVRLTKWKPRQRGEAALTAAPASQTGPTPAPAPPAEPRERSWSPAARAGAEPLLTTELAEPEPVLAPEPVVEKVFVPATSAQGAKTARTYQAGTQVLLRVSGTYAYGPSPQTADAECSAWPLDGRWRPASEWDPEGTGHLDLTVNGKALPWTPANTPRETCDPAHEYYLRATVGKTGPITFSVRDSRYRDNAGGLTVTVEETP